jgi:hypothetical protein
MLTDTGELLFETNEMDFNAIRLEPARPAIGRIALIHAKRLELPPQRKWVDGLGL